MTKETFKNYFDMADELAWRKWNTTEEDKNFKKLQYDIFVMLYPELAGVENCKFSDGFAILEDGFKIKIISNSWGRLTAIKIKDKVIVKCSGFYNQYEVIDNIIFNSKEYKELFYGENKHENL